MGRAVASAVLAGLVAGAVAAGCGSHSKPGPAGQPIHFVRYADSAGWGLSYASTMHLGRASSACAVGPGLGTYTAVTVSSFRQREAPPRRLAGRVCYGHLGVPVDASGRFPRNGVAFQMGREQGGPIGLPAVADSRFPLSLSAFWLSRHPAFRSPPGAPLPLQHAVNADGQSYLASVWIGPAAPPALRAELREVIASLRFRPLRAATRVGEGLAVLGPATRYPIGSFTLLRVPGMLCSGSIYCHRGVEPAYLIHAPGRWSSPLIQRCAPASACSPLGSFYAISWRDQTGYPSLCDLRLDRHDDQFYCTNMQARWNRVGWMIKKPPNRVHNINLSFDFAKIAWDGRLVIDGLLYVNPPRSVSHSLWPGWQPTSG